MLVAVGLVAAPIGGDCENPRCSTAVVDLQEREMGRWPVGEAAAVGTMGMEADLDSSRCRNCRSTPLMDNLTPEYEGQDVWLAIRSRGRAEDCGQSGAERGQGAGDVEMLAERRVDGEGRRRCGRPPPRAGRMATLAHCLFRAYPHTLARGGSAGTHARTQPRRQRSGGRTLPARMWRWAGSLERWMDADSSQAGPEAPRGSMPQARQVRQKARHIQTSPRLWAPHPGAHCCSPRLDEQTQRARAQAVEAHRSISAGDGGGRYPLPPGQRWGGEDEGPSLQRVGGRSILVPFSPHEFPPSLAPMAAFYASPWPSFPNCKREKNKKTIDTSHHICKMVADLCWGKGRRSSYPPPIYEMAG
ncbi:hypothetical protein DFH27DRAFT_599909 [Peziza echinospora]|nr:hypothetical protein DFH27DRAFT_599909 [Peziza echinospora]